MSSRMPPIPPASRSKKGGKSERKVSTEENWWSMNIMPTRPKRGTLQISSRTRRTRVFSVVVVSADWKSLHGGAVRASTIALGVMRNTLRSDRSRYAGHRVAWHDRVTFPPPSLFLVSIVRHDSAQKSTQKISSSYYPFLFSPDQD